jgi:hypothetical protein
VVRLSQARKGYGRPPRRQDNWSGKRVRCLFSRRDTRLACVALLPLRRLGALIVACKDGTPVARRSVMRMTNGPPDSAAKERKLFVAWTRELVQAVVDLAVSGEPEGEKKSASIHVIFFDRYEQRLMLEALGRNFPPILQATPPCTTSSPSLPPSTRPLPAISTRRFAPSRTSP